MTLHPRLLLGSIALAVLTACSQRVGVKCCAGGKPNIALCCGSPSIQN